MDPNANLEEQLKLALQILGIDDGTDPHDVAEAVMRLAELVIALDEWLRRGGFLPDVWSKGRG